VQVNNPVGNIYSDTVNVTVEAAPAITTQPQDTTIFSGQTATLSVVASGSSLSYQWYQGLSGDTSNPISGANSDTFTTPALMADTSYWVQVSNPVGNVDSDTATVTIEGAPAITTQPQDTTIFSGQTATLSVVANGSSLSYQWYQGLSGDTSTPVGSNSDTFTTPALTIDTSYWVQVSNPVGSVDSDTATVGILNIAPTADPGDPYLEAINTAIQFDGSASSDPDGDSLTYAWDFGDGSGETGVMPSHAYANAGIYDVCLIVNDGSLDSAQVCTLAVVYDPSGGFVTGSGWIISPEGAYTNDPSLSGQATFGFVSKYKKGASAPTGDASFIFDLAGFEFHSDTYEWLVVNQGGQNAQFKGSGMVNDALDPHGNPYKFMIWAGDGSPDTFRIRIWWDDNGVETVIYDNGSDQPIGAGNIIVHKD